MPTPWPDMPLSAKRMVWFPLLNPRSLLMEIIALKPQHVWPRKSWLLAWRLFLNITYSLKDASWSQTWLLKVLFMKRKTQLMTLPGWQSELFLEPLFLPYPELSSCQEDSQKKRPVKTWMKWTKSLPFPILGPWHSHMDVLFSHLVWRPGVESQRTLKLLRMFSSPEQRQMERHLLVNMQVELEKVRVNMLLTIHIE